MEEFAGTLIMEANYSRHSYEDARKLFLAQYPNNEDVFQYMLEEWKENWK